MSAALVILASLGTSSADRCGTLDHFDVFTESQPLALPPRPPSALKGTRDAMAGVCVGQEISDNFVLKWGLDAPPADDEVFLIMESLEASWSHQLDIMGHTAPYGTDDYLFNVYVGDSGGCTPSAFGVGGYYTTDDDGWPIIVLSQGVFDNLDFGQTTVAHEFYHAVQHAEGAYTSGRSVQWWWEATAMWVEGQVYPGTEDYYSFLYGYAFEPHRQLNAYTGLTSAGLLEEYHQYGAAIWPRYLTEHVTSWTTIRDSWLLGSPDQDPMDFLADALAEEAGHDLEDVFGDFAAHNATWDYFHGDNIGPYLDYVADSTRHGDRDRRVAEVVSSSGTGSAWRSPPTETLPERFGYNILRMFSPPEGEITLRFNGDAAGSDGSAATWSVRAVIETDSRVSYLDLPVTAGEGEVTVDASGTEENIYMVITVSSPAWNEGETFDYAYQFEAAGGATGSGGSSTGAAPSTGPIAYQPREKGGSCSHVPRSLGLWSLGLLGLLALRRQNGCG